MDKDEIAVAAALDPYLGVLALMTTPEVRACMETARETRERIAFEIINRQP